MTDPIGHNDGNRDDRDAFDAMMDKLFDRELEASDREGFLRGVESRSDHDEVASIADAVRQLREPVDAPDLAADVLRRVGWARGFRARAKRRAIGRQRMAVAAAFIAALGGLALVHRFQPEAIELKPSTAPVGGLATALEDDSSRVRSAFRTFTLASASSGLAPADGDSEAREPIDAEAPGLAEMVVTRLSPRGIADSASPSYTVMADVPHVAVASVSGSAYGPAAAHGQAIDAGHDVGWSARVAASSFEVSSRDGVSRWVMESSKAAGASPFREPVSPYAAARAAGSPRSVGSLVAGLPGLAGIDRASVAYSGRSGSALYGRTSQWGGGSVAPYGGVTRVNVYSGLPTLSPRAWVPSASQSGSESVGRETADNEASGSDR